MAEATFSWFKVASFIGALVLAVLAVIVIGSGVNLIDGGEYFYGVSSILSGLVCIANAVMVYKNYQKKSNK